MPIHTRRLSLLMVVALSVAGVAFGSPSAEAGVGAKPATAISCPWTNPAVVAQSTPTQLANMVLAQMSVGQEAALINLYDINKNPAENLFPGEADLCIPSFVMQDGPNGITLLGSPELPDSVAVGASFDPNMASQYGTVLGDTAALDGISVVQAPNVNTTQMPTWGRANETFGEDPFLAGVLAKSEVQGIQSMGTQVDVKHIGIYMQEYDRLSVDMNISPRGLAESYLSPLREVLDTNPLSAMCAYGEVNGTNQCSSPALYSDLSQIGYNSWFVRSDYGAVQGSEAAAIAGGLDVIKPTAPSSILAGLASGTVTKSELDRAVRDVLVAMFSHGMFSQERAFALRPSTVTSSALSTSVAVDEEGTVLLKNSGVLPLPHSAKVAVIEDSNFQSAMYAAGGSSYVLATPGEQVSPAAGLGAVLGSSNVTNTLTTTPTPTQLLTPSVVSSAVTANGVEYATTTYTMSAPGEVTFSLSVPKASSFDSTLTLDGTALLRCEVLTGGGVRTDDQTLHLGAGTHTIEVSWPAGQPTPSASAVNVGGALAQAQSAARGATYAVVVVATSEGENTDRASLSLPDYQDQLVKAVASVNPHTIVVVDSGGAVLMPWLSSVSAVLEQWYPGQVDGTALAALLTGAVDPSGHLPLTFPSSSTAVPFSDSSDGASFSLNGPDGLGLDTGYHWYSATGTTPLFPFGYGLSYTSFALSDPSITPSGDGWTVSVRATNTGSVAGRVVVQGYVTDPAAAGEPGNELKVFGSAELAAGGSTTISMDLSNQSLETYQNGSWVLVPGTYELALGQSSTSLPLVLWF